MAFMIKTNPTAIKLQSPCQPVSSRVLLAVAILAVGQISRADDATPTPSTNQMDQAMAPAKTNQLDGDLFRANEVSLDLFGSLSIGQETIDNLSGKRVRTNSHGGAGAGLNYFFTRWLGVGGDAYSENTHGTFVDNASGNLIFRLPIEAVHLAPYVYGGGGYQFENVQRGFAQVGGGLEFRFTRNFGLFMDARYVMTDGTDNFGLGRAGLRWAF